MKKHKIITLLYTKYINSPTKWKNMRSEIANLSYMRP